MNFQPTGYTVLSDNLAWRYTITLVFSPSTVGKASWRVQRLRLAHALQTPVPHETLVWINSSDLGWVPSKASHRYDQYHIEGDTKALADQLTKVGMLPGAQFIVPEATHAVSRGEAP